jgi:hypothetical protein
VKPASLYGQYTLLFENAAVSETQLNAVSKQQKSPLVLPNVPTTRLEHTEQSPPDIVP